MQLAELGFEPWSSASLPGKGGKGRGGSKIDLLNTTVIFLRVKCSGFVSIIWTVTLQGKDSVQNSLSACPSLWCG